MRWTPEDTSGGSLTLTPRDPNTQGTSTVPLPREVDTTHHRTRERGTGHGLNQTPATELTSPALHPDQSTHPSTAPLKPDLRMAMTDQNTHSLDLIPGLFLEAHVNLSIIYRWIDLAEGTDRMAITVMISISIVVICIVQVLVILLEYHQKVELFH